MCNRVYETVKRCLPLALLCVTTAAGQLRVLPAAPSPPDNPLRGLVPYSGDKRDRFPHSMEFNYLPLSDVMIAEDRFNWEPLERLLNDIASRGHQTVFRVWLEYPGHSNGIPEFLVRDGLRVTEWTYENTAPFPPKKIRTPDYEDPRLRRALKAFITELGRRYDGDPRVGYITAGLLGAWGEWHCYPRDELFASKTVQAEVLSAYAAAFRRTPILLRYPAGRDNYHYTSNHDRPFGYHDDSFAWATLDTGRDEDDWYFLPAIRAAGAGEKWKQFPIGGEIRPELWGRIFDEDPGHQMAQNFVECVKQTHATWLMDTGMYGSELPTAERTERAVKAVRHLGYEFHVSTASVVSAEDGHIRLRLTLRNQGVAPFYHDWRVEIGRVRERRIDKTWKTDWTVRGLLPGETRVWTASINAAQTDRLAVRVVNPLDGGHPLRFANADQDADVAGWLTVTTGSAAKFQ